MISHGWMIQALPACDLEQFDRIRRRIEAFRRLVQQPNAADDGFGRVVDVLWQGTRVHDFEVARQRRLILRVHAREKNGGSSSKYSGSGTMNMVKRNEDVHINCQFCASKYRLTIADCIAVWNNKPTA